MGVSCAPHRNGHHTHFMRFSTQVRLNKSTNNDLNAMIRIVVVLIVVVIVGCTPSLLFTNDCTTPKKGVRTIWGKRKDYSTVNPVENHPPGVDIFY